MKLEVEKEMIEPIIRDHIASAVIANIGDPEELIRQMVGLALSVKVNRDGKVGQYSSENKYEFIQAVAGKAIREAATEAIVRIVEEQKPAIETAIANELKRRPRATASAIVAAFAGAGANRYRIEADFKFLSSD